MGVPLEGPGFARAVQRTRRSRSSSVSAAADDERVLKFRVAIAQIDRTDPKGLSLLLDMARMFTSRSFEKCKL